MTPTERAARARKLCERLADEVAAIVPAGIGGWAPAWEMVSGPDADFLAELTAWEAEPSEEARARVRAAYRAVVAAWEDASLRFERERAGR